MDLSKEKLLFPMHFQINWSLYIFQLSILMDKTIFCQKSGKFCGKQKRK